MGAGRSVGTSMAHGSGRGAGTGSGGGSEKVKAAHSGAGTGAGVSWVVLSFVNREERATAPFHNMKTLGCPGPG